MAALAGVEDAERTCGVVGFEQAVFGGDAVMIADNRHVLLRLHPVQPHVELVVGFFIHQYVGGGIGAKLMAVHLVTQQRLHVFLDVEKRVVVGCPRKVARFYVLDHFGINLAGFQVFHPQRIHAAADGVFAENGQLIVVRDLKATEVVVRVTFCQFIAIEEQFLGGCQCAFLPNVNRIFAAFDKVGLIIVIAIPARNRLILLLDAPFHFGKERFFEGFLWRQGGLCIGVFGVQVINDFLIVPVVEPVVVIDAGVAVGR